MYRSTVSYSNYTFPVFICNIENHCDVLVRIYTLKMGSPMPHMETSSIVMCPGDTLGTLGISMNINRLHAKTQEHGEHTMFHMFQKSAVFYTVYTCSTDVCPKRVPWAHLVTSDRFSLNLYSKSFVPTGNNQMPMAGKGIWCDRAVKWCKANFYDISLQTRGSMACNVILESSSIKNPDFSMLTVYVGLGDHCPHRCSTALCPFYISIWRYRL